jgi:hypothetical protein
MIYTRKPKPPFRTVEHRDGTVEKVWCTFDVEQIDIDVFSDIGDRFITDQLHALTDKCASMFTFSACLCPCLCISTTRLSVCQSASNRAALAAQQHSYRPDSCEHGASGV